MDKMTNETNWDTWKGMQIYKILCSDTIFCNEQKEIENDKIQIKKYLQILKDKQKRCPIYINRACASVEYENIITKQICGQIDTLEKEMYSREEDFIVHYKIESFLSAIELLDKEECKYNPIIVHNNKKICCSNTHAKNYELSVPLPLYLADQINSSLSKRMILIN